MTSVKVCFVSSHNKYICCETNGAMALRSAPRNWECFEIQRVPNTANKITIKAWTGKYLCAESNGTVVGNRDKADKWEVSFFCCLEVSSLIIFFSKHENQTQHWTFERTSTGVFNLKTHHGKYLCAEPNGKIIADRSKPQGWEEFKILLAPDTMFTVQASNGRYLAQDNDGKTLFLADGCGVSCFVFKKSCLICDYFFTLVFMLYL